MTARPLAVFLHVPKTAGTTMYQILWRQYRDRQMTLHVEDGDSLAAAAARLDPGLELLRGHMPFGIHEYLERPVEYFTVVREPVDRIISLYHYVRRSPDNRLYEDVAVRGRSLAEFIDAGLVPADPMTRRFAGLHANDPSFDRDPDQYLDLAIGNLRTLKCVGINERFDESLLLLQRTFGWRRPVYESANVTADRPRREGIDRATRERIEAHCTRDSLLYAAARDEFESRLSASGGVTREDVTRFRRYNAAWRQVYRPYMRVIEAARRPG